MIAFVTAAWQRYHVTRLSLAQRVDLCGKLAELGHEATQVVVADDDNLDIAREYGFWGISQNNQYIGRKFNDGIQFALEHLEADYIVLIGSDDWMHESLFDRLPLPVAPEPVPTEENPIVFWDEEAPEAITGKEICAVDLGRGVMTTCRVRGRYGVIPWVLPKEAFAKTSRPIRDELNKGIDGSLIAGLGLQPEWVFIDPNPYCRVDWKTEQNLNSYDKLRNGIGYGDEDPWPWSVLQEHYPAELVQQAMAINYNFRMQFS